MNTATRVTDIGECRTCGKVRYSTRDQARRAARVIGAKFGVRMRAYECEGYWHLSSMDAATVAALRDDLLERCEACGKVPYRSLDAAESAAREAVAAGRWLTPFTCGVRWHMKQNRWHGPAYRGARRDLRQAKRLEAERRDADARPSRRSTKRRAKRAKGTAPASREEAA